MIPEAQVTLLLSDAAIVALLATHTFKEGDPAKAAIFSFDHDVMPEGTATPAIMITNVAGTPMGTRGFPGFDMLTDVKIWGKKDHGTIRALALLVWEKLNRANLSLASFGYSLVRTIADPPVKVEDDDAFPVYLIQTRTEVLKGTSFP